VVFSADSAADIEAKLEDFRNKGNEIDVALIDLAAAPHSQEESETAKVAQKIRKSFSQAKIVVAHSMELPPKEANLAIEKTDLLGFVKYVNDLPQAA
jgi:hypothetical protein